MKTADARLIIGKNGSDVPIRDITPAEAQLLVHKHMAYCGKLPITNLKEGKDVERKDVDELARLKSKYGKEVVVKLFGAANARLPKDFKEALLLPSTEEELAADAAAVNAVNKK